MKKNGKVRGDLDSRILWERKASFLLVDVKGLVMAAMSSGSVTSLESFSGVRVMNHGDMFAVDVVMEGEEVVKDRGLYCWLGKVPWKLCMTGMSPAFQMRWASQSRVADIIASNPMGIVSKARIASWTVLLTCPR